MTPAFAYLRVSGQSQIKGDGFVRQFRACRKFAKEHGYKIVHIFRERGVPGKTELDGRPALQALIVELLSDGVRVILFERLDRVARDVIVQETIIRDLMRRGFTPISVAEPDLCSDDPTRTLIRQILGSFFEYERKMIVSKLASARARQKSKNGRCEGRKKFGDCDGEANTLDQIMKLHSLGRDSKHIADLLNITRVPTRYGKRWHSGTVAKILKREKIRGRQQ